MNIIIHDVLFFVIAVVFEGASFCVVQRGLSLLGSKNSASSAVSVAGTTANTTELTWCLCLKQARDLVDMVSADSMDGLFA